MSGRCSAFGLLGYARTSLTQPTHCSLVLPHRFSDRVRLGAPLKEFLVCSDGRRAEAQPVSLRWGKPHPTFFDSKYTYTLVATLYVKE